MSGLLLLETVSRFARTALERVYVERLRREVRSRPVPRHVAVILDGNRRHARALGLAAGRGHVLGSETLERLLDWCRAVDVHTLTVYALSTENLGRTSEEVTALMDLFARKFEDLVRDERVHRNRIRIRNRCRKRVRRSAAATVAAAETAADSISQSGCGCGRGCGGGCERLTLS